jgi:hypothetical protein
MMTDEWLVYLERRRSAARGRLPTRRVGQLRQSCVLNWIVRGYGWGHALVAALNLGGLPGSGGHASAAAASAQLSAAVHALARRSHPVLSRSDRSFGGRRPGRSATLSRARAICAIRMPRTGESPNRRRSEPRRETGVGGCCLSREAKGRIHDSPLQGQGVVVRVNLRGRYTVRTL